MRHMEISVVLSKTEQMVWMKSFFFPVKCDLHKRHRTFDVCLPRNGHTAVAMVMTLSYKEMRGVSRGGRGHHPDDNRADCVERVEFTTAESEHVSVSSLRLGFPLTSLPPLALSSPPSLTVTDTCPNGQLNDFLLAKTAQWGITYLNWLAFSVKWCFFSILWHLKAQITG